MAIHRTVLTKVLGKVLGKMITSRALWAAARASWDRVTKLMARTPCGCKQLAACSRKVCWMKGAGGQVMARDASPHEASTTMRWSFSASGDADEFEWFSRPLSCRPPIRKFSAWLADPSRQMPSIASRAHAVKAQVYRRCIPGAM